MVPNLHLWAEVLVVRFRLLVEIVGFAAQAEKLLGAGGTVGTCKRSPQDVYQNTSNSS